MFVAVECFVPWAEMQRTGSSLSCEGAGTQRTGSSFSCEGAGTQRTGSSLSMKLWEICTSPHGVLTVKFVGG